MPVLTDFAKSLLGRALCGRTPTLPTQVYLGLGTSGGGATGVGGEPVTGGYARQRVGFTGTGPQATTQSNIDTLRFAFTGPVGVLTHVGLFDAASGGNALTSSALPTSINVSAPGTVTINAQDLDIDAV